MRRRVGIGMLVVAFVGALLTGCGSTDEPATSGAVSSLEGWANGLCTSVAAWQASTKSTSAKMANSKDAFAQGQQAVNSADNLLVSGLQGLGTPPPPASTEAKDAIAGLMTKLENSSGEIKQASSKVFRTQKEIVKATNQVKASISKMNSDISKTVTELKSLPDTEGWKAAFKVPSCKGVASG
jgi:hypothetical protein